MTFIATDPTTLPEDVRQKLLLAREAFGAGNHAEAYHWLYAIACPSFECHDPWATIEGRPCACGPHRLMVEDPPSVEQLRAALESKR